MRTRDGWPNPRVGSVVVRDRSIVGVGHRRSSAGLTLKSSRLNDAGSRRQGDSLCDSGPCCHFGKTPPCVGAILAAGITRVVAAFATFPRWLGGLQDSRGRP